MAGSYRHITDSDNNFQGVASLENLGDCYDCIEEMWDMLDYLSRGDKQKIYEAWSEGHMRKHYQHYRDNPRDPLFSFESFWEED